ncbi:hypothetical protein [Mycetohabitans endofungorum]|uniref:Uncharacterized protein n=1 Tax=Mycetohabitans endofungorum TaxID=417203 RepID=A0A2P5K738_9BURK|nr:hypothetical protein [Mycetohabitans endofungorum]PPB81462.1 hypothetical protein B0O95_11935 [Mycetohabitans endofungorum]
MSAGTALVTRSPSPCDRYFKRVPFNRALPYMHYACTSFISFMK